MPSSWWEYVAIAVVSAFITIVVTRAPVVNRKPKVIINDALFGLNEVVADKNGRPQRPIVDVIAVHGLGSKYPSTWMKDDSEIMWLRDLLPGDIPKARILAFVYPSESFSDPDFVDLEELGARLLRSILDDRGEQGYKRNRPIIFIGHSFGGLVIKQALILASSFNPQVTMDHRGIIASSTRGIIFLGTPHSGSKYAAFGIARAWLSSLFSGAYIGLLYTLQTMSKELNTLNYNFLSIPTIKNLILTNNMVCFYEMKGMTFGRVVDERSACLDVAVRIGLPLSHKNMNKFTSRSGPYEDVKRCLLSTYRSIQETSNLTSRGNSEYVIICAVDAPAFTVSDHHPPELWEDSDRWCLYMGRSGTSGTLVLEGGPDGTRFGITLGVHNFQPWVSISTDIEGETAQDIRDSYYSNNAKRPYHPDRWDNVLSTRKPIPPNLFATVNLTEVKDRQGGFRAEIYAGAEKDED